MRILNTQRFKFSRTALALAVIMLGAKMAGFAEKIIIAKYFGTGEKADAYFAAMAVILSVAYLVRELVKPTMIPVLSEHHDDAAGIFRRVVFVGIGGSFFVGLILIIWPGWVSGALVPGFCDSRRELYHVMIAWLSPTMICYCLMMVVQCLLLWRKRFVCAELPFAAHKFALVVVLLFCLPSGDCRLIAIGVSVMALTVAGFYWWISPIRIWGNLGSDSAKRGFGKLVRLAGPLSIGVLFSHLNGFIDNIIASFLPTGQLSYLAYARKIVDAVVLICCGVLVTIAYPYLADFASERNYNGLRKNIAKLGLVLGVISVSLMAVMLPGARFFVSKLFEQGQFDLQSSEYTAKAMQIYCWGIVGFSLEMLVVYGFFAVKDTVVVVKAGILFAIVDIIMAVLLLEKMEYLAIAISLVISKSLKTIVLGWMLKVRLDKLCDGVIKDEKIKIFVSATKPNSFYR